ncbi:MAG: hypothetical protein AAB447_00290 [Patescibacteria group bacterium]
MHMPSKEELTELVADGFLSATLIKTFGGTLHRADSAKDDSDFIIEFPHGKLPPSEQMMAVFSHEYAGIRDYEYRTEAIQNWDKALTNLLITTADKRGRLRITISRPYPFKDHQSAMRVSCRILE